MIILETNIFPNKMSNNNTSNKRIAQNTLFLSIRMVIVLGINLFTTRIVLQALGVVDYGVYNVVCGFVAMFAFLNTSMSNGIQRFFNFEYGKNGVEGANKVFCTAVYIQAMLAIIIVVLVEPFGLWYLHNKMVIPADRMIAAQWIFQLAILTFVIGIMSSPFSASVTAHERMDFYALISIMDAVFKLAIAYVVLVVTRGDRLILYAVLQAGISVVNITIYYFYCKKRFKEIHFHFGLDKKMFKNMLGFSGWNIFGTFSKVMENQGLNLVLNFFFGPVVNAARGVAVQVNGAVRSFVSNITIPVRPQVVQSYASGNVNRALNLTFSVSKITSVIVVMLAIPICLEIDYILHLWLGENVPDHTAAFSVLVIATTLFNSLHSSLSGIVHATGIMKKYQLICSIIQLASIPISIVLIKLFQIPEIAFFVVFVLSIFMLLAGLLIVKQLVCLDIKKYLLRVLLPILLMVSLSLLVVIPLHLAIGNNIIRLIVVTFTTFILVVIIAYFVVFEKKEKEMVFQMINSMIRNFKNNNQKTV